jgi:hypothetical protein
LLFPIEVFFSIDPGYQHALTSPIMRI